jgi:hypothetical protein
MATLNHILQRGRPRKAQLNIIDIFNVPETLAQRGFVGITEGGLEDTLIRSDISAVFDATTDSFPATAKEFLEKLVGKSFRSTVRSVIYGLDMSSPLIDILPYSFDRSSQNERRYGKTIELLMAYLCVEKLKAFSASFGVHVDGAPFGGDFDCIANFQNSVYHFEIKSGNARNITEADLSNFIARHDFLSPEASVLFLDYDSIPTDVVLKFKNVRVGSKQRIHKVFRISEGSCTFFQVDEGILVVNLSKNGNILDNLRIAMRYAYKYKAHHRGMGYLLVQPEDIGYEGDLVWGDIE